MDGTQGRSRTEFEPNGRAGKRAARVWIAALALLGVGAAGLATAESAGGGAEPCHGYRMSARGGMRIHACHAHSPIESNARMDTESGTPAGNGNTDVDASEGIEAVPVTAMRALLPLRAEHYASACNPRRPLCHLIAAHVRTRFGSATPQRDGAAEAAVPEPAPSGRYDAIAVSHIRHDAQRYSAPTRRFDGAWR